MEILFPLHAYWWFYIGFVVFVMAILILDLGVFHKESHVVSFKEAGTWSIVWVTLALIFNYGFYRFALWKFTNDPFYLGLENFDAQAAASQAGLEFLAGYLIEKALAVDNIFVFIIVFSFFGIPGKYQHRILFYGILGALVFRAIFIALGSVLMQYNWIVMVFGIFLIFTGIKMVWSPEKEMNPGDNPIIRWIRKIMPVTDKLDGQKFFTVQHGRRIATPLFLTLVFIELTDIVFAVDSVPAIFAVTKEPLIVFTSNIFAILGLRSMYFMLSGVVDKFHLLKYGLAAVLVFVGLKMSFLNTMFGGHFPITWSLGIIAGCLALSIVASILFPKKTAAH